MLVSPVWPIGLILLLRKLTGGSRRRASRHPYDIQREGGPVPGTQGMPGAQRQTPPVGRQHVGRSPRQGRPVNRDRGKGLTVWGIVLTVIFGIALTGFPAVAMSGGFLSALAVMSPVIGFFGGGLAMIWAGTQRTKKAKRFRKYLALIGRRESISITTLAQAMPVSVHKACDDLQDMLDSGILETGYLDMSTGRLILSDEGLQEEAPPAPEPDEPEPEEDVLDMNDDDAVLGEIRRLNDDIDDPVMSQKIDRIGEDVYKRQEQDGAVEPLGRQIDVVPAVGGAGAGGGTAAQHILEKIGLQLGGGQLRLGEKQGDGHRLSLPGRIQHSLGLGRVEVHSGDRGDDLTRLLV